MTSTEPLIQLAALNRLNELASGNLGAQILFTARKLDVFEQLAQEKSPARRSHDRQGLVVRGRFLF